MNLTAARKRATLELVANFLDNMDLALRHITLETTHTAASVYPSQTPLAASSYTTADGRTVTVGSAGGGRSESRSPVERAVIDAHARLRDAEANLWDDFNALVGIAHAGSHQAAAAAKRLVPGFEAQRCNRGIRPNVKPLDGHTVWQRPECDNFPGDNPVIEGLCDQCVNAMNDWRIEHGYERIVRDALERNYRRDTGGRFTAA